MAALRYWIVISAKTDRILLEKTLLLVRSLEEFCQSQAWYWFGGLNIDQGSESDFVEWWKHNQKSGGRSSFSVNVPWSSFLQNWIFAVEWQQPLQLEASIDWGQFHLQDEAFIDRFNAFLLERAAIDAIEFTGADGKMTKITGKQTT
jgi:hypothetical protein